VKISLDNDVDDADVKDDEMSWSRVRTIRFAKSNDVINEDSFFEKESLELTNSNEIVIFLEDSREWRNAKLDGKLKIFFKETIVFLKSTRSMTQDSDHLFFSMNLSRTRMNFEVIEKKYQSMTFVTKDFVFIATKFENLWSVRKKSFNWKQISPWCSEMNYFIREFEMITFSNV
jgi:hypothetical protein